MKPFPTYILAALLVMAAAFPAWAGDTNAPMLPDDFGPNEPPDMAYRGPRSLFAMELTQANLERFMEIRDRRMAGAPPATTIEEQVEGYYLIILGAVEEMGFSFQKTLLQAMRMADDPSLDREEKIPALVFLSDGIQFNLTIALYPDDYLQGRVLDQECYDYIIHRLSQPPELQEPEGEATPEVPQADRSDMDAEQLRLADIIDVYTTQIGFAERSIERMERLLEIARAKLDVLDESDREQIDSLEREIAQLERDLDGQKALLASKRRSLDRHRTLLADYEPSEHPEHPEPGLAAEPPFDTPEGFRNLVDGVAGIPWGTHVDDVRGLTFKGVTDSGIEKYDLGPTERLYFFNSRLGGYNYICPLEKREELYTYIDETFSFSYTQMGVYYYYLHKQVDVTVNERKGIVRVEYLPIIEEFEEVRAIE